MELDFQDKQALAGAKKERSVACIVRLLLETATAFWNKIKIWVF
jgi:hypothetical protein